MDTEQEFGPGISAVVGGPENARAFTESRCARLERAVFLPDCGHWCQQEKADEVSDALLGFARRHAQLFAVRASAL